MKSIIFYDSGDGKLQSVYETGLDAIAVRKLVRPFSIDACPLRIELDLSQRCLFSVGSRSVTGL